MTIDLNKTKKLISKKDILDRFNEIEIFQKYINESISLNKLILSPLRKEKNASFGFFIGEGNEICFKDFVLGAGDFVKFIMLKFGRSYFEALSTIACDFDLQNEFICKIYNKTNFQNSKITHPTKDELLAKYTGYKLGKTKRDWKDYDTLFWQQYGISLQTLHKYRVEAISFIFIGDNIFPADKYTYCFKELKDGIETYKIYQPFNKKYKWINNHDNSVWQGWTQLPESGEDLIITKSLKDVMSLYELGFNAIALQSENIIPKKHVFQQLEKRFKYVTLLYDNDFDSETNWGKIFGDKLSTELGITECYIKDEYKCKDVSDLIKKYGKVKAKNILLHNTLMPF